MTAYYWKCWLCGTRRDDFPGTTEAEAWGYVHRGEECARLRAALPEGAKRRLRDEANADFGAFIEGRARR